MKTKIFSFSMLLLAALSACSTNSGQNEIIVTKAIMQIKPEMVSRFKQVAAVAVKETLSEEGCLNYAFYQDAADSTVFFLYEEYKTQADLDAHLAKPYLVQFRKDRKSMVVGGIPYVVYSSEVKHTLAIDSQKTEFKFDK